MLAMLCAEPFWVQVSKASTGKAPSVSVFKLPPQIKCNIFDLDNSEYDYGHNVNYKPKEDEL